MASLAPALVTLRNQFNEVAPLRSKVSDGWIGDRAHASRKSDHNPNRAGIVCALDLTDDIAHGLDAGVVADTLRVIGDARTNYIISEGRIANAGMPWRKYTGSNRHDKHFHISVDQDPKMYNNPATWSLSVLLDGKPSPALTVPTPKVVPRKLLKRGMMNDREVIQLQTLLNQWLPFGSIQDLTTDGDFGPMTDLAVRAFQKHKGLTVDGQAFADSNSETWKALEEHKKPEPDQETMRVTSAGAWFDEIQKHYEGKRNKVYIIDGVLHAGWGHRLERSEGYKVGDTVSEELIERWYEQDKDIAEARLLKHINAHLDQNQFDAVASIIWNGGDWDDPTDKRDSPLYYRTPMGVLAATLNAGDMSKASQIIIALGKKPTASGAVFRGIENRRRTEYEVFTNQTVKFR